MNNQRVYLAIIVLFSVLIRVSVALYMGNEVSPLPGIHDQISYHNLAIRVAGGHGFSFGEDWWPMTMADTPTAHWSYLYTLYLSVIYGLFNNSPLAARIIQAVIVGTIQPWLAFLIGRRLWTAPVGLAAAMITAIYFYFIFYAAALMTEAFYITAILISLYLLIRLADLDRFDLRSALLLGLSLGTAVLLRQLYMLIIPFLFVWLGWVRWQQRSVGILWREVGLALGVVFLLILPFSIYGSSRFDRFVLLNTNAGYAFFWGNHPVYGNNFEPILPAELGSYGSLIPEELRGLDEANLEKELLTRGLNFIFTDPIRYIRLSLSRIPPYFKFWPDAESSLVSNITRVGSFGLFIPFMLFGLGQAVAMQVRTSIDFAGTPTILLILFALLYTTIHILTWTLIRYRLPVDAVLVLFAALPITAVGQRLASLKQELASHRRDRSHSKEAL